MRDYVKVGFGEKSEKAGGEENELEDMLTSIPK